MQLDPGSPTTQLRVSGVVRKAMVSYGTYSIPGKTAALVPEFAVEDLPLGRLAALVPEFVVKDLP